MRSVSSALAVSASLAGTLLSVGCADKSNPLSMIPDGYRAILEHEAKADAPAGPISVEAMLARARGERPVGEKAGGEAASGERPVGDYKPVVPLPVAPSPPISQPPRSAAPPELSMAGVLATHIVRFNGDSVALSSEEQLRLMLAVNRLPADRPLGVRLRLGASAEKGGVAGAFLATQRARAVAQALPAAIPVEDRLFRPVESSEGVAVDFMARRPAPAAAKTGKSKNG